MLVTSPPGKPLFSSIISKLMTPISEIMLIFHRCQAEYAWNEKYGRRRPGGHLFAMIFAAKNKNRKMTWRTIRTTHALIRYTRSVAHTHSHRHIGIVFFPLLFFCLFFSHLVHAQWKYVLVSGSRAHTDVDCFSFRYERRQRWRWRRRRRRRPLPFLHERTQRYNQRSAQKFTLAAGSEWTQS